MIRWEELVAPGSEAAAREKGRLRIEGKEYVVQDGDVVHFRFSVRAGRPASAGRS